MYFQSWSKQLTRFPLTVKRDGYFCKNFFSPVSLPPAACRMSDVKLRLPKRPASWLMVRGTLLFIRISKKYNMALCPASSAMLKIWYSKIETELRSYLLLTLKIDKTLNHLIHLPEIIIILVYVILGNYPWPCANHIFSSNLTETVLKDDIFCERQTAYKNWFFFFNKMDQCTTM